MKNFKLNSFTKTLNIFHIRHVVLLLLLFAMTTACDKEDAPIPEEEQILIDPLKEKEEEEEEKEEETPQPPTQNDINQVDTAVSNFMTKHGVPGAALAVSVNEKMVYTKGFGLSNTNTNKATEADDVFRIASISKTFTATAIMKLVEEGKLALSDKVFGPGGVLGSDFGSATLTTNEMNITVDHLLIHSSGGWGVSTGGDPMDFEQQLDANSFIEYIFNNWDLQNAPGTTYSYSNYGYWLLARIIERVSQETFEAYISTMLTPTGATSFKTTTFREEDREPNEVEYYASAQENHWIYTMAPRRDGDGGVVISTPDLLRFICAIDGRNGRQDLISTPTQGFMAEPSEFSILGRGFGVWEQENLLFFTGSLPGTRTWFYLNPQNGVTAVIALNSRGNSSEFDNDLNTLVYNLVKDASIPWQTDLDLF
ncbi:serine hydrolase domain-containing protein [Maribacter sp. R77961]|uniref:serine hydrolase domain-containing protein n=1 Tax=Maribacter sp. R77961 TaxID=3093871 RepID=UPI0037C577BB